MKRALDRRPGLDPEPVAVFMPLFAERPPVVTDQLRDDVTAGALA